MGETLGTAPCLRPYLFVDGAARALDFYQQAFGAHERVRLALPDGRVAHAEVQIGDSVLMVCDPLPQFESRTPTDLGGTTAEVFLYVDDVDATVRQAVEAGATLTREPADQPWGDRLAAVTDPFGQVWLLATRLENLTADEMVERIQAAMRP